MRRILRVALSLTRTLPIRTRALVVSHIPELWLARFLLQANSTILPRFNLRANPFNYVHTTSHRTAQTTSVTEFSLVFFGLNGFCGIDAVGLLLLC